ncbi:MAG TPA: hypothetical protein VL068_02215, partial [Microthrixaceae bacterium]|nr:hypothetical protein [Microthrixaceae bacterium]
SQVLDGFMKEAVAYSIRSKGGLPRGTQTGTATVGVVVTDRMAPDAQKWATRGRSTQFAALGYPVAVEVAEGRVSHPKRILIGAMYSGAMKRFVQAHVSDVLIPR